MEQSFRLMIACGDAGLRARLAGILSAESRVAVVAAAQDLFETVALALETEPDIVVLDSLVGGAGTTGLLSVIRARLSPPPSIILVDSKNQARPHRTQACEAEAYLCRACSDEEILTALRGVARTRADSKRHSSVADLATVASDEARHRRSPSNLSEREQQVLMLLGHGLSSQEISACLFLGETTVKTYTARIREKLNLRCRSEVVAHAACDLRAEHNQTEKRWSLLHEQLSKAFYLSPVGMVISDFEDGDVLDVNQAFLDTTGLRREKVVGHPVADIGIVVETGVRELMVNELRHRGEFRNREYSLLSRDGEVKTVQLDARLISVGNEKRVLSVLADVTERSIVNQATITSERKYRMVFEHMPQPLCLLTPVFRNGNPCDCLVVDVNTAFEKAMNLARDKLIGRSAFCGVVDLRPSWLRVLSVVALAGETVRLSDRFKIPQSEYDLLVFSPYAGHCAILFIERTTGGDA